VSVEACPVVSLSVGTSVGPALAVVSGPVKNVTHYLVTLKFNLLIIHRWIARYKAL
jgi:hypothetical protein